MKPHVRKGPGSIFPKLNVGDRVRLPGGHPGTVQKPAVTQRGSGDIIFVEVKLDNGRIAYPRRTLIMVIS